MNIPSECRIASIGRDHAMILPHDANPKPDGIFGKDRPRDCRAAECDQQFPSSDGDCHTPLPCEVRKGNDGVFLPKAKCVRI